MSRRNDCNSAWMTLRRDGSSAGKTFRSENSGRVHEGVPGCSEQDQYGMGSLVSHIRQPQMVQGPCGLPDNREDDGKDEPTLPKDEAESKIDKNRMTIALGWEFLFFRNYFFSCNSSFSLTILFR